LLGKDGLLNAIRSIDIDPAGTFIDRLLAHISTLCNGRAWNDDVTAMLFRATGNPGSIPFSTRLLAPFRVIKGWAFPDLDLRNVGGAILPWLNSRRG
jgi:hypothetical protein